MVATWLTELYLDQINRAMLDAQVGAETLNSNGTAAATGQDGASGAVATLEQQLQVIWVSCSCQLTTLKGSAPSTLCDLPHALQETAPHGRHGIQEAAERAIRYV